ncbi:MAG: IS21-like element helper ATPase IstB [Gammaproteobacteria bacterium]
MSTTQTIEQLRKLKLSAMCESYSSILKQPQHLQPDAHELLAVLTDAEITSRINNKTERLRKLSKLRYHAFMSEVLIGEERNLSKAQVQYFIQQQYLAKAENSLITGPTGSGKTYLACAIGHHACQHGIPTLYLNLMNFMNQIQVSKIDNTYMKYCKQLSKINLLILDEFGMAPLNYDSKVALFNIIEERYDKLPTIIAGQIPTAHWHEYFNEPTLADALMDRLTAKANFIELKGKSLRTKNLK